MRDPSPAPRRRAFRRPPPSPLTGPAAALGLHILDIPMPLPPLTIGMAWHPRHAADGGHHWLRGAVRRAVLPGARGPAHGGGPETPDRGGPDPSAGGGPDTAVPGH